jgi:site-specific DNA-methyltransferase (adenine-specific)
MSFRKETLAEGVELYLGDCLEVLPTLAGQFDAIVTDPPYGLGKKMQGGTWGAKDEFSGFLKWDLEAKQEWVDLILAAAVPTILWGGNYFNVPAARCWLFWNKINSVPTMADAEMAWTNFDKPAKRFDAPVGRVEFGHPTSKPLPLIEWCVRFLPSATCILDPFLGSGTSGVAAVKAGKRFIGIELDEIYFGTACRRIEAALREPDMFVEAPAKPPEQLSILDDGEAAFQAAVAKGLFRGLSGPPKKDAA